MESEARSTLSQLIAKKEGGSQPSRRTKADRQKRLQEVQEKRQAALEGRKADRLRQLNAVADENLQMAKRKIASALHAVGEARGDERKSRKSKDRKKAIHVALEAVDRALSLSPTQARPAEGSED